ncbi:hypothetical protein EV424DRAFT_819874 [Suillus variegatus]|nr:hypothetical protein EV424DRAFT_819874 [Suillus variegatus]
MSVLVAIGHVCAHFASLARKSITLLFFVLLMYTGVVHSMLAAAVSSTVIPASARTPYIPCTLSTANMNSSSQMPPSSCRLSLLQSLTRRRLPRASLIWSSKNPTTLSSLS